MLVTCSCGKRLRVEDDLAGKRIKCLDCGQLLLVPRADEEGDAEQEQPAASDDEDDAEPVKRKKSRLKKKTKKSSVNVILIAGIGGGVLAALLLCCVLPRVLLYRAANRMAAENTTSGLPTAPATTLVPSAPASRQIVIPSSELPLSVSEDATYHVISITNNSRDLAEFHGAVKWVNTARGGNSAQGFNWTDWKKGEAKQLARVAKRDMPKSVHFRAWGKTTDSPPGLFNIECPVPGFAEAGPGDSTPPLGPAQDLKGGIAWHQVHLIRNQVPMRVWVYLPAKAAGKAPCVLIAPAGSPLFVGMKLSPGDQKEHLPYVRAGFAVVSFDLDGPMSDRATDQQVIAAATAFRSADAGVANARAALDYVLEKVPQIDANRVYIAGHSSAGTLALLAASKEPRIKGCIAYAPCTDVVKRLTSQPAYAGLSRALPWMAAFLSDSSPRTHVAGLKCPVFLFHATDDTNVPVGETVAFANDLKRSNPRVTLEQVPRGGHFDAMIKDGIPKGIDWLQKLSP
jgi:dienelactone hydrolase